jgi:hypothetical protein
MPVKSTPEGEAIAAEKFYEWAQERHPEIVARFSRVLELRGLEAVIAGAIEEANKIRAELGEPVGPVVVAEVAHLTTGTVTEAANPKRTRTPRKPKDKQAPPVQEVVEPVPPVVDNGDDTVTFTSTEVVDETPPEFEPDDFEDFEIPADDANDEF